LQVFRALVFYSDLANLGLCIKYETLDILGARLLYSALSSKFYITLTKHEEFSARIPTAVYHIIYT